MYGPKLPAETQRRVDLGRPPLAFQPAWRFLVQAQESETTDTCILIGISLDTAKVNPKADLMIFNKG